MQKLLYPSSNKNICTYITEHIHELGFLDAEQLPCFNALEQGTIVNRFQEETPYLPPACKNNWLV